MKYYNIPFAKLNLDIINDLAAVSPHNVQSRMRSKSIVMCYDVEDVTTRLH